MRWLPCLLVMVSACGGDEGPFIIVTIDARPAVHDIRSLTVTLSNEGAAREDTFQVGSDDFPATFSISAPGRLGQLGISVDARDQTGILVGRGDVDTSLDLLDATVVLDSADFVVNTEFADDQFPSNDFEANGFQLGAGTDGTWTAVYRDTCIPSCNMFARRFDETGTAIESAIPAGPQGFEASSELTTGGAIPAVATSGTTTAVVWDFFEPAPGTTDGIACRTFDAAGNPSGPQVAVSIETLADVVSVAPLPSSSFVLQWNAFMTANTIKTATVNAQCQPANVVQVSTTPGTSGASRGSVATNGDRILYAWIIDNAVRGRVATATPFAFLNSTDIPLVAKTATEQIEHVRVAPLGTGFAIVVRWALTGMSSGAGRLELYRVNNTGALMGGPTLISNRSGSDFESKKSFGVASRDDGALLVVWHACDANGDGSGCGVFGRVLRPSGVPVGDEFVLATTTELDQTNPSAIAIPGAFATMWQDLSGQDPDKSGSAARARIVYPAFDDAKLVLGATCTAAAECGTGLTCGASSEGGQRCFATCTPGAGACPGGGTCSGNACVF
ncbi:MAG: hypothetical protein ABI867_35790 [Kofleriaceae bacterium]